SFSGDAYLNEMGITTQLFPDEITKLCNNVSEPNDKPGPDGLADVDHFARFLRATKAPARDQKLADTTIAKRGRICSIDSGAMFVMCEAWPRRPPAQRSMAAPTRFPPRSGARPFILLATSCCTT